MPTSLQPTPVKTWKRFRDDKSKERSLCTLGDVDKNSYCVPPGWCDPLSNSNKSVFTACDLTSNCKISSCKLPDALVTQTQFCYCFYIHLFSSEPAVQLLDC